MPTSAFWYSVEASHCPGTGVLLPISKGVPIFPTLGRGCPGSNDSLSLFTTSPAITGWPCWCSGNGTLPPASQLANSSSSFDCIVDPDDSACPPRTSPSCRPPRAVPLIFTFLPAPQTCAALPSALSRTLLVLHPGMSSVGAGPASVSPTPIRRPTFLRRPSASSYMSVLWGYSSSCAGTGSAVGTSCGRLRPPHWIGVNRRLDRLAPLLGCLSTHITNNALALSSARGYDFVKRRFKQWAAHYSVPAYPATMRPFNLFDLAISTKSNTLQPMRPPPLPPRAGAGASSCPTRTLRLASSSRVLSDFAVGPTRGPPSLSPPTSPA